MSLSYDSVNILRPATSVNTVKNDPREAACYPCVPWFGRITGNLEFDDHTYPLSPTLRACDPVNAIHGHGWLNSWRITKQASDQLECCFAYKPQERKFPFPFRAVQSFSVSDQFTITLSIENTGATPMPAGLGLHPFFPRTEQTRLRIKHIKEWRLGTDSVRLNDNGALPDTEIDHSGESWTEEAILHTENRSIALRSNTELLHLYAPQGENFFCLEPVTHLPGRFGADILAPGEVKSLSLAITVE